MRRAAGPVVEEPAKPHRTDVVAIGAAVCIVLGWFVLTTLDTQVAGVRLSFHFYDMWSLLQHPSRLVTGLTDADRVTGMLFGALCLAALAAAFVPRRRENSGLRILYFVPLALMLVCGALLYEKTSGDVFANTYPPDTLGADLTALANTIANRVSAAVSRHVSVGFGAYLAFAASVVLAARGLPRSATGARYFWKV